MYWTLELASHLEDAPWPATKDELIDYAIRSGAPVEVIENLQALEDDGEPYENIEEIKVAEKEIAIYPNPTSEILKFLLKESSNYHFYERK
jgi:hypothetical protein